MSLPDPGFVPDDKLERLTARLRTLRRRVRGEPTDVDAWELDLYSYDEALVVAADLLEVPVPSGARDEMGAEARATLEAGLTAAGLDLDAE